MLYAFECWFISVLLTLRLQKLPIMYRRLHPISETVVRAGLLGREGRKDACNVRYSRRRPVAILIFFIETDSIF